jgi:hypothetical protein
MAVDTARHAIALEIFGVRIVVHTPDEALISALALRLPPAASASGRGGGRRYVAETADPPSDGLVVYRGVRKPARAASIGMAADLIVDDVQRMLAHRVEGLVFVHAGVVAHRGRALVLPGRSRSGKSELVAALVSAGADYLSDEFAVFDADGLVHPYARAIARRRPDGTRVWLPPEALGATVAREPVRPALVAFLRFSLGASWRPRPLSAGHTVLGLLRHTVAARRRLALARAVLVPLGSSVAAISAVRGEAGALAERLLGELA